jgi:hypothetical protein
MTKEVSDSLYVDAASFCGLRIYDAERKASRGRLTWVRKGGIVTVHCARGASGTLTDLVIQGGKKVLVCTVHWQSTQWNSTVRDWLPQPQLPLIGCFS